MNTFSEARSTLSNHQKTQKGAPPYSRFINRPFGRIFAAAAFTIGATPNQVTMASAACSAAAIALIATVDPNPAIAILVVVLLVLGYALDSADGQLARLRGGGSPAGEWLDHTVDATKIVSIHLAVLISLYRFGDLSTDRWLLLPIGFAITATVLFFSWILRDVMLAGTEVATNRVDDGTSHSAVASLARLLEDYGVLMLCMLFLPWTDAFLGFYGVLFAWSAFMTVVALPRRFAAINSAGANS